MGEQDTVESAGEDERLAAGGRAAERHRERGYDGPLVDPMSLAAGRGKERHRERGYDGPLPVLDPVHAGRILAAFEESRRLFSGRVPKPMWHKCHLLYDWADELVHHRPIVDAVEGRLGPDILCWTSHVLVLGPAAPSQMWWCPDPARWGRGRDLLATVRVVLTTGCDGSPDMLGPRPAVRPTRTHGTGEMTLIDLDHWCLLTPASTPGPTVELAIHYVAPAADGLERQSLTLARGQALPASALAEPRPEGLPWRRRRALHNDAVRLLLLPGAAGTFRHVPGTSDCIPPRSNMELSSLDLPGRTS